jgi:PAS domain S-box-containing protein
MRRSRARAAAFGFGLGLVLLLVAGIASYSSLRQVRADRRLLQHGNQIIATLGQARESLLGLVSSNRGYLLDQRVEYLQEFDAHVEGLSAALTSLKRLTRGEPLAQTRLDAIRPRVDRLRAKLLAAMIGASPGPPRAASGAERTSVAPEEIDSILQQIRRMQSWEIGLLGGREAGVRSSLWRAVFVTVAGSVCGLGLLLAAALLFARELRARARAEDAARKSERFLDSVIDNIPDMIFLKDAGSLRFARLNKAGERLLGIAREELLGKGDHDFFPADEADLFLQADRAVLDGGLLVNIPEEEIHTRDRGVRVLHTKKIPILDEDLRPRYLLGISEDITERKENEARLRRRTAELAEANRELESFSYSVSHDLRAPLRAIDGFAAAIEEDCLEQLNETGRSHLLRIRSAAQVMAELIDDLLELSRVSRREIVRREVDMGELARDIERELRAAEPGRDVELQVGNDLLVQADRHLLRIALANLIGNAWKFTSRRKRAHVSFVRTSVNGFPSFAVIDDGAGFDMAYADKLFAPFRRLHSEREFPGTGIGLATVARIVRRHGGTIWAESSPDQGARFHFTL